MAMNLYFHFYQWREGKMIHVHGDKKGDMVMDSILTSIKKLLGIDETNTDFDGDIIIYINGVIMTLTQLGQASFKITDKTEKWSDYLGEDSDLEAVKTYIYHKVRLIFDPSTNSNVLEAIKQQIQELEWRLILQV